MAGSLFGRGRQILECAVQILVVAGFGLPRDSVHQLARGIVQIAAYLKLGWAPFQQRGNMFIVKIPWRTNDLSNSDIFGRRDAQHVSPLLEQGLK